MRITGKYKVLKFLLLCMLVSSCDAVIEPIANIGTEYSVYGSLDMQKTPNHIRVYDTKKLLTPETSEMLNVKVFFTDLTTNETQLLEDRVVLFDSIYTHNYPVENPIEYDNRYLVEWENKDGFADSLITVTPKQTVLTVLVDSVECGENFLIHLSNINLDAGEQLIAQAGIKIGKAWFWTPRKSIYTYSKIDSSLIVGWSPADLIRLIFGPASEYSCLDISSETLQFKFMHIGYVEGMEDISDFELSEGNILDPGHQIVLAKYSGETEITYIPDD